MEVAEDLPQQSHYLSRTLSGGFCEHAKGLFLSFAVRMDASPQIKKSGPTSRSPDGTSCSAPATSSLVLVHRVVPHLKAI